MRPLTFAAITSPKSIRKLNRRWMVSKYRDDSLQQPSAPSAASSSRITSAIYRRIAGVRSPAIEPRESPAPGASDRTAQFV